MDKAKVTVMVVEDEDLLLQAIAKKLGVSGMDVVTCTTGQQALDYLKNMQVLPNAIWLDYYLQDMNGLEFMIQLKRNKAWQDIPVLVVSNSAGGEKIQNLLALGAKKYLIKAEHRLDEIIKTLNEIIVESTKTQTA